MPQIEWARAEPVAALTVVTVEQPGGERMLGLPPAEAARLAALQGAAAQAAPGNARVAMVADTCRRLAEHARMGASDAQLHHVYAESMQDLIENRRISSASAATFCDCVAQELRRTQRHSRMHHPFIGRPLVVVSIALFTGVLGTVFAAATRAFHHAGAPLHESLLTDIPLGGAAAVMYSGSGLFSYAGYNSVRETFRERRIGAAAGRLAARIDAPVAHSGVALPHIV